MAHGDGTPRGRAAMCTLQAPREVMCSGVNDIIDCREANREDAVAVHVELRTNEELQQQQHLHHHHVLLQHHQQQEQHQPPFRHLPQLLPEHAQRPLVLPLHRPHSCNCSKPRSQQQDCHTQTRPNYHPHPHSHPHSHSHSHPHPHSHPRQQHCQHINHALRHSHPAQRAPPFPFPFLAFACALIAVGLLLACCATAPPIVVNLGGFAHRIVANLGRGFSTSSIAATLGEFSPSFLFAGDLGGWGTGPALIASTSSPNADVAAVASAADVSEPPLGVLAADASTHTTGARDQNRWEKTVSARKELTFETSQKNTAVARRGLTVANEAPNVGDRNASGAVGKAGQVVEEVADRLRGRGGEAIGGGIFKDLPVPKKPQVSVSAVKILEFALRIGGDIFNPRSLTLFMSADITASGRMKNPNSFQMVADSIWADALYEGVSIGKTKIGNFLVDRFGSASFDVPLTIVDFPVATGSSYATLTRIKNKALPITILVTTLARIRYRGLFSPRVLADIKCNGVVDPVTVTMVSLVCGRAKVRL